MDHADLVAALTGFPGWLAAVARAAAIRPTPPGEWTSAKVIRHLIACETDVHQARIADLATLTTRAGPGRSLVHGRASRSSRWMRCSSGYTTLRAATIAAVAALDDAGWARTGLTPARLGVWDVAGLLANAVAHDEEHLAGARTLRRAPGIDGQGPSAYPWYMVENVKQRRRGFTRVSAKHQATLPVDALRRAGIGTGDTLRAEVVGPGEVRLVRDTDPVSQFAGALTGVYPAGGLDALRDEWR